MRCTSMHSLSSSYTYRAIWLLHTLVKLWVVSVSFLFFFHAFGKYTSWQTDWLSLIANWTPIVKRLPSGMNHQTEQFFMQMNTLLSLLMLFFFFFSEEYMCSLVPQSSTMCIMYAIDCCSSPTGLISRSRWRNGCRCSSNQTCNHRYYSYAWRV